ncbi:uncharacterized protein LOC129774909 [Toxorhynchites rutilus septentrionalis]|uniref:uncharacterized protein LOC129774909 n=1 Tax=Toxorhynchites rutilus septentrionalis TaxID=329112 RepID=UPI00247A988B|nr:uncharacterized protein LOC129774909 [Toxorhynchites rutilus septentrionalis]
MADYCNIRSTSSSASSGAVSCLGTFRPSPGYQHHTPLIRAPRAGSGRGGGLMMAVDTEGRVGTIDSSSSGSTTGQRVRIVRLTRPQSLGHHQFGSACSNFGFSVRGGLEYGTGFFVSAVEKDSEADRQGLRVGDQVIRVNGYHVDDAVHRELAQFVSNQERLVLKVRSVGILPVKERAVDPLTWHVVSFNSGSSSEPASSASSDRDDRDERSRCGSSSTSSSSGTLEELAGRDLKIILSVAPRQKLGCGICKGPEWKPGIFVQFTKDGGVAREAGLRPGDQILSCNGKGFLDITFAEAVSVMKGSHVLELVVRPGAGIDMFPGESSGYNSSASSVNGDQSPCWGDSNAKRLSIVREESISTDRRGKERERLGPKASMNRRNNTTIIEFSENGTVVNNSTVSDKKQPEETEDAHGKENRKLADICFVSKQSETKTIIVEVHRSASANSINTGIVASSSNGAVSSGSHIPPPPPLFADKIPPPPPPSSGLSSGYSTTKSAKSYSTHQQQRSPSVGSSIDSGASSGIDCGPGRFNSSGLGNAISEELKRRAQKKGTATTIEPAAALTELENRLKEKRFRPPTGASGDAARHSALMDEFKAVHKRMFKNGFDNAQLKRSNSKDNLQTDQSVSVTRPTSNDGVGIDESGDKNKGTMSRVAATEMAKANGDTAELESIESFKLTNPTPSSIRPPSYYFSPQNTGPATMKKSQKPIAVAISEYSNNTQRDQPMKTTNLNGTSAGVTVGNLKHELEKTLSLSNSHQKSLSRENLVERIHIGAGGNGNSCSQEQTKLCRSSSLATVGKIGAVSNGNRITIAISNFADAKK